MENTILPPSRRKKPATKARDSDSEGTVAEILVAEDDESVRIFVARALTHYGHHVTAVEDGESAVAQLERGRFDLMLTDIVMPGIDGLQLTSQARHLDPDLDVVMMTGFATARTRADRCSEPVAAIISKPFSLTEICDVVDRTLKIRR
jgi:two-component system, cell cycle response regulator CpdR